VALYSHCILSRALKDLVDVWLVSKSPGIYLDMGS